MVTLLFVVFDSLALTRSALGLAIPVSFLFALVFAIFSVKGWLGYGAFPLWAAFVAFPSCLVNTWAFVLRYWVIRVGAFELLSRFTVVQAIYRVLMQIACFPLGGLGLVVGEVMGRFSGLRLLWQSLPRRPGPWINWPVLRDYRSYPLVQLPSSLLDTLALMAPVPVFSALYGVGVAGSLSLTQRIISLPLGLIGGAVADVFYNRVAELARKNPQAVPRFLVQTSLRLGLISLGPGLLLLLLGPQIFEVLFGSSWRMAGEMAAAYAPWMVAQMAVSPVSRVVFLSKRSWIKLFYDSVSLLVVTCLPYLAMNVWRCGAVEALWILSWAKVALYLFYLLILAVASKKITTLSDVAMR